MIGPLFGKGELRGGQWGDIVFHDLLLYTVGGRNPEQICRNYIACFSSVAYIPGGASFCPSNRER